MEEFRRVFFILLFEHLHYTFCQAFPYVTQGWQVQAVKHNPLPQINYPAPRSCYNYWHRPSHTSESQKILNFIITLIVHSHIRNMKALSEPFPKFILSVRLLLISPCSKKKKKSRNSFSCSLKRGTAVMTSQTNQCHFQQNYFIFLPTSKKLEQFHNKP